MLVAGGLFPGECHYCNFFNTTLSTTSTFFGTTVDSKSWSVVNYKIHEPFWSALKLLRKARSGRFGHSRDGEHEKSPRGASALMTRSTLSSKQAQRPALRMVTGAIGASLRARISLLLLKPTPRVFEEPFTAYKFLVSRKRFYLTRPLLVPETSPRQVKWYLVLF